MDIENVYEFESVFLSLSHFNLNFFICMYFFSCFLFNRHFVLLTVTHNTEQRRKCFLFTVSLLYLHLSLPLRMLDMTVGHFHPLWCALHGTRCLFNLSPSTDRPLQPILHLTPPPPPPPSPIPPIHV